MKTPFQTQRATSILGLSLDGNRLEGVALKRTNGSAQVVGSFGATLALDPLNAEPELVGSEIRNHLDAAEIRERRCVVALPLHWALTLHTKLPDQLPADDLANFLQIEAERGFPYGPESLIAASSLARWPEPETWALQVAVPRDHVVRLERVLRAARLVPVSFSLGLPALERIDAASVWPVFTLAISDASLGLQVAAGGGVLALRSLHDALESDGAEKFVDADAVARELRVTLGQLPAAPRSGSRPLRIFGSGAAADRLAAELAPRIAPLGLALERATRFAPDAFGVKLPADAEATPALALAARHLAGQPTGMEFLPPKVSAWRQFTAKHTTKKLAMAGTALGVLALLTLGAFGYQQWQLSRLRSEWSAMAPRVTELEDLQKQIRQFRPWFDASLRSLSILRRLTEAFPEDGTVTAKSVELRENGLVSCAGTARDSQALIKTIDGLRAASEVAEVQVDQLRGKSPVQFTFNFHWGREKE